MPKETISTSEAAEIQVGWTKDLDVQVGVLLDSSPVDPKALGLQLLVALSDRDRNFANATRGMDPEPLGTAVLEILGQPDRGAFATLNRDEINRVIRSLRKARDAAYGADA